MGETSDQNASGLDCNLHGNDININLHPSSDVFAEMSNGISFRDGQKHLLLLRGVATESKT